MIENITPLMDVKSCQSKLEVVFNYLNEIKFNEENYESLSNAQSYLRQISKNLIFLEKKLEKE